MLPSLNYNWHKKYVNLSEYISTWSKDPSTKVGAVIINPIENRVISIGYNGFPRGVTDTEERWERPTKYDYVVHAEENAIINCKENMHNAYLYLNFEPRPCLHCAKLIIQAGIQRILGPNRKFPNNHDHKLDAGQIMLQEANVVQRVIY